MNFGCAWRAALKAFVVAVSAGAAATLLSAGLGVPPAPLWRGLLIVATAEGLAVALWFDWIVTNGN